MPGRCFVAGLGATDRPSRARRRSLAGSSYPSPVKLTRTQAQLLFVTLMAAIMSGVMSLALGIAYSDFSVALRVWPQKWFVAFLVAWPTAFFVVPVVRRVVDAVSR